MTHLKELHISHLKKDVQLHEDGLLKILQQLSHSNVTILDITGTGVCELLKDSSHDYYSAMKALICPPSGRLEELHVGDIDGEDDTLAGLVSGPSSLKTLMLYYPNLSPHVLYLSNTCLTTLQIESGVFGVPDNDISPDMATIVEHNKTLQHLEYGTCSINDIDSLKTLVCALSNNNTLKSIGIGIRGAGHNDNEVSSYMRTHHRDLTSDPRVIWVMRF